MQKHIFVYCWWLIIYVRIDTKASTLLQQWKLFKDKNPCILNIPSELKCPWEKVKWFAAPLYPESGESCWGECGELTGWSVFTAGRDKDNQLECVVPLKIFHSEITRLSSSLPLGLICHGVLKHPNMKEHYAGNWYSKTGYSASEGQLPVRNCWCEQMVG